MSNQFVPDQLTPCEFKGFTNKLTAPVGWNDKVDGSCGELPIQAVETVLKKEQGVWRLENLRTPVRQSCWRLSLRQRLRLLLTGKVWLVVVGMQPPVSLYSKRPYGVPPSMDAEQVKEMQLVAQVREVLSKHRGKTINDYTVSDCREIIAAYGDPYRVLDGPYDPSDEALWQAHLSEILLRPNVSG